jgi:hypothetical protein
MSSELSKYAEITQLGVSISYVETTFISLKQNITKHPFSNITTYSPSIAIIYIYSQSPSISTLIFSPSNLQGTTPFFNSTIP